MSSSTRRSSGALSQCSTVGTYPSLLEDIRTTHSGHWEVVAMVCVCVLLAALTLVSSCPQSRKVLCSPTFSPDMYCIYPTQHPRRFIGEFYSMVVDRTHDSGHGVHAIDQRSCRRTSVSISARFFSHKYNRYSAHTRPSLCRLVSSCLEAFLAGALGLYCGLLALEVRNLALLPERHRLTLKQLSRASERVVYYYYRQSLPQIYL